MQIIGGKKSTDSFRFVSLFCINFLFLFFVCFCQIIFNHSVLCSFGVLFSTFRVLFYFFFNVSSSRSLSFCFAFVLSFFSVVVVVAVVAVVAVVVVVVVVVVSWWRAGSFNRFLIETKK